MACEKILKAALALLFPAIPALAQVSVINLLYESPTLVAPVAILQQPVGSGSLNLGIMGWTVGAEYRRVASRSMEWAASLDATPLNAHRSNAFYVDGEPASDSGFEDASFQFKGGFKRRHSLHWSGDYRLSLLYEKVKGLPAAENAFWEKPFAGILIGQTWEQVRSFDPLMNQWDGFKVSGQYQLYAGDTVWWRGSVALGLGRRVGSVFLRSDASLFLGDGLNDVSRVLVGGGWELPGVNVLYGYHYGEFRVDRGLLASAGADWNFVGQWELGLRVGLLADGELVGYGDAIRLGWQWNGSVFTLGWGVRENPLEARNLRNSVVSASWTVALWNPLKGEW